eukprot:5759422-Amphidinium_carterae.1
MPTGATIGVCSCKRPLLIPCGVEREVATHKHCTHPSSDLQKVTAKCIPKRMQFATTPQKASSKDDQMIDN